MLYGAFLHITLTLGNIIIPLTIGMDTYDDCDKVRGVFQVIERNVQRYYPEFPFNLDGECERNLTTPEPV